MSSYKAPRLWGAMAACAIALPLIAQADDGHRVVRAAAPEGAIQHVLVINLENENFADTFGASSPAKYLNTTLLAQGELLVNYFGTSHVSLGNYISQVSGQGTNVDLNNDCPNLASLRSPPVLGGFLAAHPHIDIALEERSSSEIVRGVAGGMAGGALRVVDLRPGAQRPVRIADFDGPRDRDEPRALRIKHQPDRIRTTRSQRRASAASFRLSWYVTAMLKYSSPSSGTSSDPRAYAVTAFCGSPIESSVPAMMS